MHIEISANAIKAFLALAVVAMIAIFYFYVINPLHTASDRIAATCDRALATNAGWVTDRERFVVTDDCTKLLKLSLEPCSIGRTEYFNGKPYFCRAANPLWEKDRSLITAYDIRRGKHDELVEIGVFPGYEVTFY